jgi:CheY-like chemotaxis protein
MDMMLPDLSGVEVTRQLKTSKPHSGIPIVMITGHSERDVVVQSLAAGAVDFLVKPFTREAFAQKVEQYLGRTAAAVTR